jgi:hypothetical protein
MSLFLTIEDLAPFAAIEPAKAQAMIDDAEAMALLAAPCISSGDFTYTEAVRAILRGAVLRWHEAGTGALQSQTNGPFAQVYDTRQVRRGMFQPDEIVALQNLCSTNQGGAYSLSLAGPDPVA